MLHEIHERNLDGTVVSNAVMRIDNLNDGGAVFGSKDFLNTQERIDYGLREMGYEVEEDNK